MLIWALFFLGLIWVHQSLIGAENNGTIIILIKSSCLLWEFKAIIKLSFYHTKEEANWGKKILILMEENY
jgi:hypothetical protein